jgi:outer membrane cobalamin receptor
MVALEPPAIVQPGDANPQPDVIEVIATRPDQTLKIDRRTYRVNQTPHSAQKNAIQLLRGLPAVTISPDDDINLLGSDNVKVFIDGRQYQGDSRQYLKTLHGTDIERIEIITNPSAQYSAEGTAGIINLVLLKKQGEGTSGSAGAEASSLKRGELDGSLKYKNGKWTYEFQAHARMGTSSRSTYHKLRTVEASVGGPETINTEDGTGRSERDTEGDASARLTYELDSRSSISASVRAADARPVNLTQAHFVGLTPDFQSFIESVRATDSSPFVMSEFSFDHKGSKDGESVIADLTLAGVPGEHGHTDTRLSDGGSFFIDQRAHWLFGRGQFDWQHPIAKGEILSVGGEWDYERVRQNYAFASLGDGSLGPDSIDEYTAANDTLAGYMTFQKALGTWTFMPGIRVERNTRHVSSRGQADISIRRTNAFPTFHIEHPLTQALDLTLSYGKRIDRAQPNILRPYRAVEDVLTIMQGNPRLKDQSTDSYEINLHYHHKSIDAGVILYDRETSRLWSTGYTVVDGVNLYTWVNAGHLSDRGAEFDVSAPVVKRVKLNASLNLFDERAPVDTAAAATSETTFRYTTNATLEWDGPDHDKRPGDVAQFQWLYNGPSRQFQFRRFDWNWLSLSYTHSFSRTVSVAGTLEYSTATRHRLLAPLVQEYYAQHAPAEFKLKLLKTFGQP